VACTIDRKAVAGVCRAVLASRNFEGLSAWGNLCTKFGERRFRRSVSEPDKTDTVYKFGGFLVSFSRFNFVLHARGEAQYRCVLGLKINGCV